MKFQIMKRELTIKIKQIKEDDRDSYLDQILPS